MPDASADPVCSCAHLPLPFAHGTAGAACARHSLRPLLGGETIQGSGASRREAASSCLEREEIGLSRHGALRVLVPADARSAGAARGGVSYFAWGCFRYFASERQHAIQRGAFLGSGAQFEGRADPIFCTSPDKHFGAGSS